MSNEFIKVPVQTYYTVRA